MKKSLLLFVVLLSAVQFYGQKKQIWMKSNIDNIEETNKIRSASYSDNQALYSVDLSSLKHSLRDVSDKISGNPGVEIEFPNSLGELEKFSVWENSNFAPELQAQFPEIRAYIGIGIEDKTARINFSLSPDGIQTVVFRADSGTEFIEPFTKDHAVYVFFDSRTRNTTRLPFNCGTIEQRLSDDLLNESAIANRADNQTYKTMRLALSCTGEYGAYFGGTIAGALAGMNATMTRVNGIFEKDMALHLNIIANNNLVVYTNASTDPYSPASGINNWNDQLQSTLTSVIGEANYDIGHLFGATGGGGNAGCIGCVCGTGKGSAYTAPSNNMPEGDTFDIDYVIHEMGHQLGATHTFSHNSEGSGTNVEPGSGSTIMGYAGITNYDVQSNSDAYFTYRSILQIQTNLSSKTCPVSTPIVNTPPVVDAGEDFIVPSGTPYFLTAIASDAEGDTLSYCWEQNNSAGSGATGANSVASPTKTSGPNFRSFIPKSTGVRSMPDSSKVLAGTLSTMWESVSTVARTLKFSVTVRDNNVVGAQTKTDEVNVTSKATYNASTAPTGAGPFVVTSQSTNGIAWSQGSTQTISWDVNNTTSLPGSTNVNIKLSLDGGVTFPYTLAADTPNDGNETITVPSTPASQTCRVLVEPTGNRYFAINSKSFYVGYQIVNTCNTYSFSTPFNLPDGSNSYTVKQINVPTAGTISDVNFTINATHPNLQNLVMAVIRPGGSLSTYFNQQCTGSADMNVTFDAQGSVLTCASPTVGVYKPASLNLDTFASFNQQGNWQFGFKDVVAGNTGTINSIDLEVCTQTLVLLANESFSFEDFALYPNPNNGTFAIQFNSNSSSNVKVEVFDIEGRMIFDKEYENNGVFSENIDLKGVQSGLYLVRITDGSKRMVRKINVN
ncbi:MAG: T9SS type A sorting domain-containing protein [Flavobacterium sp.]|nr:T9SS type A sorting domain-containing protein [Flavobacterium sp.]